MSEPRTAPRRQIQIRSALPAKGARLIQIKTALSCSF